MLINTNHFEKVKMSNKTVPLNKNYKYISLQYKTQVKINDKIYKNISKNYSSDVIIIFQ